MKATVKDYLDSDQAVIILEDKREGVLTLAEDAKYYFTERFEQTGEDRDFAISEYHTGPTNFPIFEGDEIEVEEIHPGAFTLSSAILKDGDPRRR